MKRVPGFEDGPVRPAVAWLNAEARRELWPVDRLLIAYLLGIATVVALFHRSIAHYGWILAAHAGGILLISGFAVSPQLRGVQLCRHWYPLPYIALCYREISLIIGSIHGRSLDAEVAAMDFAIWRCYPTVWLERIQNPILTEVMQLVYALFVPAVLLIAVYFWRQQHFEEFRSYAFLLTLGFLVSYVGYLLVPVRGPRFFLDSRQTEPLRGIWSFEHLRTALDVLESASYDCFPSGHLEMAILAWWTSRQISPSLGRIYAAYMVCTVFATIYLRYHYTVDLLAGVAAAWLVLAVAPNGKAA